MSAPKFEIDQRSREARLRAERLLLLLRIPSGRSGLIVKLWRVRHVLRRSLVFTALTDLAQSI
jgi:hypothetical protein